MRQQGTDFMIVRLAVALLTGAIASSTAFAQSQEGSYYSQPLEGIYSQDWWVENIYYNAHRFYSVDVKGDGKLGEFSGNLAIHCGPPITWQWGPIVQDLFLDERSVPYEALVSLTAYVCRDE
jgi:hypothetical protein